MSSQISITLPNTLPDASLFTCLNQTMPSPPLHQSSSLSTCSISAFIRNGDNLLSTCCNTTDHVVISPYVLSASNDLVMTGGYTTNGCDWTYCNVTSRSAIDEFGKCVKETAPQVDARCFTGGVKVLDVTSGGLRSVRQPWKRTEKKTLSGGLLIALGVAGLFMG